MLTRHIRIIALVAFALATGLAPAGASAAPRDPFASAGLTTPVWVAPGASLPVALRVRMTAAMPRASVRVTLYDASGGTVWQRTRSASSLRPVVYVFSFVRSAADARLAPGVYRAVATASTSGGSTLTRSALVVVAEPKQAPSPVSVVVRVVGPPLRTADGTWTVSPDGISSSGEAAALGALTIAHPELHITVAVPAYMFDEWHTLAAYTPTDTPSGLESAAQGAGAALDALSGAAAAGTPFLRVPYADPDLTGLESIGSTARDLPAQLAKTRDIMGTPAQGAAAVETTGAACLGDVIPAAAGDALAAAGARFVIADASCLRPSSSATAQAIVYRVVDGVGSSARDIGLAAMVVDRRTSRELATSTVQGALAARLYERSVSKERRAPLLLELLVGPGAAPVSAVTPALVSLAHMPWVHLIDAPTAASARPAASARFAPAPRQARPAPQGYWDAVGRALMRARALADAAGPRDPDGRAALADAFVAESRAWAGPDGAWALAPRGLAFASAADRIASRVLASTSIDAPPLTLSGSSGKVPVSITNNSTKVLSVLVRATSRTVKLSRPRTYTKLRPGENILYVPVDLGAALHGQVVIATYVDGIRLAVTTSTVHASGLDREVIISASVLLMIVLLVIIWRRARRPGAAPVPDDEDE